MAQGPLPGALGTGLPSTHPLSTSFIYQIFANGPQVQSSHLAFEHQKGGDRAQLDLGPLLRLLPSSQAPGPLQPWSCLTYPKTLLKGSLVSAWDHLGLPGLGGMALSKRDTWENDHGKPKASNRRMDVPSRCRLQQGGQLPSLGLAHIWVGNLWEPRNSCSMDTG